MYLRNSCNWYSHVVCLSGYVLEAQIEMAPALRSKYLCVTALWKQHCETEVDANLHRNPHKMLLSSQFLPLTNVVSQEQVQRGGNLHILLGAR